jgi:hypothetical protein
MNEHEHEHEQDEGGGAGWPYSSILIYGFFGSDSPEGRRVSWRTGGALFVLVCAMLGVQGQLMPEVPPQVWAVILPLSVASMVAAQAEYVRSLDELRRTLQLKAFAFAYGCAMTLAAAVYGFTVAGVLRAEPVVGFGVLVCAEPLRALALGWLVKRYE